MVPVTHLEKLRFFRVDSSCPEGHVPREVGATTYDPVCQEILVTRPVRTTIYSPSNIHNLQLDSVALAGTIARHVSANLIQGHLSGL
uniref:GMC_oxred_C domain-containing protein n=1 Tax=Steinernema glaseri TaxID=37863 RepID=A0A1I7YZL0_9BILA